MYLRAGVTPPTALVNGTTRTPRPTSRCPSVLLTPEWVTAVEYERARSSRTSSCRPSQLCAGKYKAACTAARDHGVAMRRSGHERISAVVAPGARTTPGPRRGPGAVRRDRPAVHDRHLGCPAAAAAGHRQELRPRPRAGRHRPGHPGRPGDRAGRRQRCRQDHADQDASPASGSRPAARSLWNGSQVHITARRTPPQLGIATVYQDLALCDNLDIVQNMMLGHEKRSYGAARRGRDGADGEADARGPAP